VNLNRIFIAGDLIRIKKTVNWIVIGLIPIRIRIRLPILIPQSRSDPRPYLDHIQVPDRQALDADPDLDPAK
jgi:hypothetical protein